MTKMYFVQKFATFPQVQINAVASEIQERRQRTGGAILDRITALGTHGTQQFTAYDIIS